MDWFLLSIVTAVIWGVLPYFEKQAMAEVADGFAAVFMRTIGASFGLLIPIFLSSTRTSLLTYSWKAYLYLFITGFVGSILGQLTYLTAIRYGEVSRVTPVAASWPVIAFLVAIIVLGEPFTAKKGLALLFIVCGISMLKA